jgi:hypothetical protein
MQSRPSENDDEEIEAQKTGCDGCYVGTVLIALSWLPVNCFTYAPLWYTAAARVAD